MAFDSVDDDEAFRAFEDPPRPALIAVSHRSSQIALLLNVIHHAQPTPAILDLEKRLEALAESCVKWSGAQRGVPSSQDALRIEWIPILAQLRKTTLASDQPALKYVAKRLFDSTIQQLGQVQPGVAYAKRVSALWQAADDAYGAGIGHPNTLAHLVKLTELRTEATSLAVNSKYYRSESAISWTRARSIRAPSPAPRSVRLMRSLKNLAASIRSDNSSEVDSTERSLAAWNTNQSVTSSSLSNRRAQIYGLV